MRKFISNVFNRGVNAYYRLGVLITLSFMNVASFADIPSAPSIPGGNTSDYMKTGQGVFDEGAKIMINVLYVVSIMVYCGALLWLLVQAKKSKEWGNFFKGAGVGLAVLVLILILLNQAKSALTGS